MVTGGGQGPCRGDRGEREQSMSNRNVTRAIAHLQQRRGVVMKMKAPPQTARALRAQAARAGRVQAACAPAQEPAKPAQPGQDRARCTMDRPARAVRARRVWGRPGLGTWT